MTNSYPCPHCGGSGITEDRAGGVAHCTFCNATGVLPDGTKFEVRGHRARDVERVFRRSVKDAYKRNDSRWLSPWISGSFYLVALLLIVAMLGVVADVAPIWVLPGVVVGGLLGLSMIGALQLRHDGHLDEQGFLRLMWLTLHQLPLVRPGTKGS